MTFPSRSEARKLVIMEVFLQRSRIPMERNYLRDTGGCIAQLQIFRYGSAALGDIECNLKRGALAYPEIDTRLFLLNGRRRQNAQRQFI